jgi:hypothetical protein
VCVLLLAAIGVAVLALLLVAIVAIGVIGICQAVKEVLEE